MADGSMNVDCQSSERSRGDANEAVVVVVELGGDDGKSSSIRSANELQDDLKSNDCNCVCK